MSEPKLTARQVFGWPEPTPDEQRARALVAGGIGQAMGQLDDAASALPETGYGGMAQKLRGQIRAARDALTAAQKEIQRINGEWKAK